MHLSHISKNLDITECKFCGKKTMMLGTKLCDPCWELETRIRANPELAKKILAEIENHQKQI